MYDNTREITYSFPSQGTVEDVEPPVAKAAPPPPPPPSSSPPQSNDNTRPLIDPGTGEPIELYTGELITAESGGADQYVHLGRPQFFARFGFLSLNRWELSLWLTFPLNYIHVHR